MSEYTSPVYADAWIEAPNKGHGETETLQALDGSKAILLKWRDPWDPDGYVTVGAQILQLHAKGASTGERTISARAISTGWTETGVTWEDQPDTVNPTCDSDTFDVLVDGDVVELDITAIAIRHAAEGGKNRGILITTDADTTLKFYSSESDDDDLHPQVVTTWTEQPDAPTLKGVGGVRSQAKPEIGFADLDVDGDLSALRLQVDAAADEGTPDFDTGEGVHLTTEALLDLAATAFPALADGAVTQLRGTATIGGVESAWSPWYSIGFRPQRTLAFDSPDAGVVGSTTPLMLATYNAAAAGGEQLTSWQLRVWDATGTVLRYDSGRTPATDPNTISHEIPETWRKKPGQHILDRKGGGGYLLELLAWGSADRVAGPDDPEFVRITQHIVVDDDGVHAAPTAVTAAPTIADEPGLRIGWTIAPDAPDQVIVATADGKVLAVLDAADVNIGGTSYAWEWVDAPPHVDLDVVVAQVRDGSMSPWSAPATGHIAPEGLWVIDPITGDRFVLSGLDVDGWSRTDLGYEYNPVGSDHTVWIVHSQHGLSGSFKGDLRARPGRTYDQQRSAVDAIAARPKRTMVIIAADFAIPARLRNLGPAPSSQYFPGSEVAAVPLSFDQHGTAYIPGSS